jgi:D-alanyl-lipoteichoic acid acyltransferase DltB (MBOAT superfamily)
MLFNSYVFIFAFLPLTLAVFYLLGAYARRADVAIIWLVLASLLFYGWWNPRYLVLIIASMMFNYWVGMSLSRSLDSGAGHRRILLAFGVGANLLLLGYYKYANFFVQNVDAAFGLGWQMQHIVLPLGISFFTFTQIAYLVDAFRGEAREYNAMHYGLFVTFFPHLIAGPVLHHKEMMPQFGDPATYRPRWSNFAVGLTIFAIGLFKKVIIADNFARVATPVFSAAEQGGALGFFDAWTAAFAYSFQLYFDFSGYSDMAIGLARLFGIRLPLNFHSPYQALNIIDFWRRWHMTLSRFLRDYLYIPLGGNRKGSARRYINLMITMLLGGLWHGAGWTFVVWGALHGAYLMVNYAWRRVWRWGRDALLYQFAARCLTLLAVVVGWVYFRAESFSGANRMLASMTNLPNSLHGRIGFLEPLLSRVGFAFDGGHLAAEHFRLLALLLCWLAVVWYWPNTQQWMARARPALEDHRRLFEQPCARFWRSREWRPGLIAGALGGLVAAIALLGLSQVTEFLYFQF